MNNYLELIITVEKSETEAFYAALNQNLRRGWTRPTNLQPRPDPLDEDAVCYVCKKRANRKAAAVLLSRRDPQTLTIANIVPKDVSALTIAEYNAILRDFHRHILHSVRGFPTDLLLTPKL